MCAIPHTLSRTRYPMVREATLGYPTPDLQFPQRQSSAIYIKTKYTDSSITVKIFGGTGGLIVEGITSERRNLTDPTKYFDPDPALNPGAPGVAPTVEPPGFTADVARIIHYPDGTKKTQKWTWIYERVPRSASPSTRASCRRSPPAVRPHSVSGAGAGATSGDDGRTNRGGNQIDRTRLCLGRTVPRQSTRTRRNGPST